MYTNKTNILQLAALMRSHNVKHIVITPGSRNIPLAQTFARCKDFTCYSITDERSAGFFALGLALKYQTPAAVCCTSGSALLNLHPAVAEAFYQQIPLLVISADRPAAWIGQMDGQTLPQPGVFDSLTRHSVNLPETENEESHWFCNRLINEALLELNHRVKGPVHINVPISEPFFDFPITELPKERVIHRYCHPDDNAMHYIKKTLSTYNKYMVVCGQDIPQSGNQLPQHLKKHCVCLAENLYNGNEDGCLIHQADCLLAAADKEQKALLAPQLVITFGGHIVSKRLKQFLRTHRPAIHWHITPDGDMPDLFGSLTAIFEMPPHLFFNLAEKAMSEQVTDTNSTVYPELWKTYSKQLPVPMFAYSEMKAIGCLIDKLNAQCTHSNPNITLHLANSSAVRYAQFYPLNKQITVCCNRGVNGIEGSLSTAVGYAAASTGINFVIIGDLSFFYDMNALWNEHVGNNLRILLLNNGGGEIFHALPGLKLSGEAQKLVTAPHDTSARSWSTERGFGYLSAHNETELEQAMNLFTGNDPSEQPLLLEVFTNKEEDIRQLKSYYKQLSESL